MLRPLVPDRDWRQTITLPYGVYDPDREELFVVQYAGLFSCLSVTLWCICDLLAAGHVPKAVNFTATLASYKDEPDVDVYPDLFETQLSTEVVEALSRLPAQRLEHFDHHGDYRALDLEVLALLVRTYLRANSTVTDRADRLRERWLVPDQRYVGVCVRGTDKARELPLTDTSLYVDVVGRLLADEAVDRVLIQTDQSQVCDLFRRCFDDRCDVLEEIPRTRGRVAMHNLAQTHGDRTESARDMMAAVSILSTMTEVVTYTGNIGTWIVLLRESTTGVHQATPEGIVTL